MIPFGRKIYRVGSSLVIKTGDKLEIWENIFSVGGVLQWVRAEKKLVFRSGEGTVLHERIFKEGCPSFSGILPSGAPRPSIGRWVLALFFFVILPMMLALPVMQKLAEVSSVGTMPVIPGKIGMLPSAPSSSRSPVIDRDPSWMKGK